MKLAERVEKPREVEVIQRRVKPEVVEKLQADVTALEKDVADKQKVIDKLLTDLAEQQSKSDDMEIRLENLERVSP